MEKYEIWPTLSPKTLKRWSPYLAELMMSGTSTPVQNFITIRLGVFAPPRAARVAMHTKWFRQLLFLSFSSSLEPIALCTDFYDQYFKRRRFAQGCAFWRCRKQNFTFRPPKAQICHLWPIFWRDLRVKKALTVSMLTCKLPLIVIVAPWKLHSE